jgi:hypothetical protein
MGLDQHNQGTQVFIDKWDGSAYGQSLNVSSVLTGADLGYESWGQSGLRRISGTITLGGFPQTPLSESLSPRSNPSRFQKGNRVRVLYQGTQIVALYILGFPLPASPGNPELSIELGCVLSLLSYRQPPSDAEAEAGNSEFGQLRSAQGVIAAYLSYAGVTDATTIEGTCPGSLYVQQKDGLDSWVEEAGRIAYANGCYLWQKPNGVVQVSAIALSPTAPSTSITVGGWDGGEIEFEPVAGGETPVERVICEGERVEFEDTGGSFSDVATEFGLASSVSPFGADTRITIAREIVNETFSGTVRNREVYRYECKCAVNPFYPVDFGLVPSQVIFETWNYEGSDSGRLRSYSKTIRAPIVAVAQDYAAGVIVDQPGSIEDMGLRIVESESATYTYDDQDAVRSISRSKKQIAVAIAPTLFLIETVVQGFTAFSLVPAGGISETWQGDHEAGLWRHKTVEYGSLAKNSKRQSTISAGQLATGLVRRTVRTSNTGQTQPPSAERREPTKIERREAIEGAANFELIAPSPFEERERYYEIPYGNTISKLNQRAEELGTLLIGRSLGASFTLPITGWTTLSNGLHPRIDFTLPGGEIQAFLADNLSFAIDANSAVVSGDGIFLGVVAPGVPQRVRRPFRETASIWVATGSAVRVTDNQPDILEQSIQSAFGAAVQATID